jgi:RND family efflux transporter MFP subunit
VTLLHIPAPLGGVIVERPVSLGQIIETTTTLFRIIDDSIIIAEGDAFEDMLSALRVGQRVRLMVAAYPKQIFDATLTFIHPVIDPEKRTAHIWAQLSNPDSELKPDMFAQLNVVIGGGSPVVTIPADAVMAAEGEAFVFVERDGGLARVAIATGARNDQFIEVKRGLHAGDRVVTDGKRQVYTKLLTLRSGGAALGGHTH